MKNWIAPLIFIMIIIVPIAWALIDVKYFPDECTITTKQLQKFSRDVYTIDSAQYMSTVKYMRSKSDSELVVFFRTIDGSPQFETFVSRDLDLLKLLLK